MTDPPSPASPTGPPGPVSPEPAEHLASVLAIVAEAVVSVDSAQRIIFFNQGAERIFGYAPDQVLGRPLDILLPARYRSAHRQHVDAFAGSSITARRMGERLEVRALRRGGEEFPAEASIARTEGPGGPILTVVLRDVTAQRRIQEELARRERQLADAEKIAHIGSWVWHVASDRVVWSDELYRIYGLPVGSAIDFDTFIEHVHPEDRQNVRERIERARSAGGAFEFQHRVVRPDGRRRWIQSRGEVVRGEAGRPVRLVGTAQDITHFRQAAARARQLAVEQAARRAAEAAERRMAFLARATAELAASLDYETTLTTIAGLAVPEIADWCAVDLLDEEGRLRRLAVRHQDPERVEAVQRLMDRYPPDPDAPYGVASVIRTGQTELARSIPDTLVRRAARDEEHLRLLRELKLRSYIVAPLTLGGRVLGALTFVHAESGRQYDEEDRLLAEDLARRAAVAIDHAQLVAALGRAVQAKTDFMATMSHELRTPLNAIVGYTELLEDGIPVPLPEAAREHVHRVRLSAQHLIQLIDEILTFSRVQAEREVVERTTVRLDALVDEIRAIIGPLAEAAGLEFRVDGDRVPEEVVTDPKKLRQILLNLLGNAVKFTERGRVELRIRRTGAALELEVADTGPGIPAADRRQLFEPFWQGDQSRTRQQGGAGLGLAISDRFARLLGGDIRVESEPGRGSTFTLRLPLESA